MTPALTTKLHSGITDCGFRGGNAHGGVLASAHRILLFSVRVNGSVAHLVPVLRDRGITAETAPLAASMLGVLTLIGQLLTGALLDRFAGSLVTGIFFAIAAAGVAVLSQAHTVSMGFAGAMFAGAGVLATLPRYPVLTAQEQFSARLFGVSHSGDRFSHGFVYR